MNRTTGLVVIVLGLLCTVQTTAQTYDLSDYLYPRPGFYCVHENSPPGGSPTDRTAEVVQQLGQYTLVYSYRLDLQNTPLRLESVRVFEKTASYLIHHGDYDYNSGQARIFNPPIKIPRQLGLNVPFTYAGKSNNDPFTLTVVVTADNVKETVKAGTFDSCIRVAITISSDRWIEAHCVVMARDLGYVHNVYAEVDEGRHKVDARITERVLPLKP